MLGFRGCLLDVDDFIQDNHLKNIRYLAQGLLVVSFHLLHLDEDFCKIHLQILYMFFRKLFNFNPWMRSLSIELQNFITSLTSSTIAFQCMQLSHSFVVDVEERLCNFAKILLYPLQTAKKEIMEFLQPINHLLLYND